MRHLLKACPGTASVSLHQQTAKDIGHGRA